MHWIPAIRSFLLLSLALLLSVDWAAAQDSEGWNSPRALDLIERARARRTRPQIDSTLQNYRAEANGYVYFFLDRADTDERTLVKVDQVALEVYWAAPDLTKQRIIGLREEKTLPSRIHYHLDHLTVVQNEFDDRIRMGDGDEVRDVLHPAAPGADSVYDFRMADSLTLRLGGAPEPIRVYELEVRPKRVDRPAFVGSLFVDRASADIVRMTFTFTPASYVDPRLDYIRVSLDNGLWQGRHWLPYEQRMELRRQVPELDFPAGGVIRGTMRIGGYTFNQELPPNFFRGARVVALPERLRKAHEFENGIFAELNEEGLSPTPDLATLRTKAMELVGRHHLSGLPRLRFYIPNASSVLRYNRAEALYLGGGVSYVPAPGLRADIAGGFATGPGHASISTTARARLGESSRLRVRTEWNALRDLGLRPGTPGILNTLASAFAADDFLDPYYASGVTLELEHRLSESWRATLGLGYERHRDAKLEQVHAPFDDEALFRPVRPIDRGSLLSATATLHRAPPVGRAAGWSGSLSAEAGSFEGETYLRPQFEFNARRGSADRRATLEVHGAVGFLFGTPPAQRLFLLGGAGTMPGYGYRRFVGDRFALAGFEVSRELFGPWVRLRGIGSVGWTDLGRIAAPAAWDAAPTDGLRASAGLGLGLIYDLLRIDFARPIDGGGRWRAILSVSPGLHDIL